MLFRDYPGPIPNAVESRVTNRMPDADNGTSNFGAT